MNLVAALEGTRALSFLRLLRFSSIRTKMLMFAVVATLLPSLTTVWISYIENKRALQAKASEELLGVSAQALREVDLWTKELRYDLRVFSSSYEVTENLERIPLVNGEPVHSGIYFTRDRKSTRLNSSHGYISYAVFCLKKKRALKLKHMRVGCSVI